MLDQLKPINTIKEKKEPEVKASVVPEAKPKQKEAKVSLKKIEPTTPKEIEPIEIKEIKEIEEIKPKPKTKKQKDQELKIDFDDMFNLGSDCVFFKDNSNIILESISNQRDYNKRNYEELIVGKTIDVIPCVINYKSMFNNNALSWKMNLNTITKDGILYLPYEHQSLFVIMVNKLKEKDIVIKSVRLLGTGTVRYQDVSFNDILARTNIYWNDLTKAITPSKTKCEQCVYNGICKKGEL